MTRLLIRDDQIAVMEKWPAMFLLATTQMEGINHFDFLRRRKARRGIIHFYFNSFFPGPVQSEETEIGAICFLLVENQNTMIATEMLRYITYELI